MYLPMQIRMDNHQLRNMRDQYKMAFYSCQKESTAPIIFGYTRFSSRWWYGNPIWSEMKHGSQKFGDGAKGMYIAT